MDPCLPAPVRADLHEILSPLPPTISLHSILQPLLSPSPLSSLHPYSSAFSYGSKRVITEIQTRPTKDHRGIKPAVQFSAGVSMLGIHGAVKFCTLCTCFIVLIYTREISGSDNVQLFAIRYPFKVMIKIRSKNLCLEIDT